MKHVLSVMDRTGDTRVEWDVDDVASVDEAKKVFDRVRAEGYAVYKAEPGGNTLIREFDPSAEKMVATPRLTAG